MAHDAMRRQEFAQQAFTAAPTGRQAIEPGLDLGDRNQRTAAALHGAQAAGRQLEIELAAGNRERAAGLAHPKGGAWNLGASVDGMESPWTTAMPPTKTESYMSMASAELLARR
jgi:hypothetical protein